MLPAAEFASDVSCRKAKGTGKDGVRVERFRQSTHELTLHGINEHWFANRPAPSAHSLTVRTHRCVIIMVEPAQPASHITSASLSGLLKKSGIRDAGGVTTRHSLWGVVWLSDRSEKRMPVIFQLLP